MSKKQHFSRTHEITMCRELDEGCVVLKRLHFLSGRFISNEHYQQVKTSEKITLFISQDYEDDSVVGDEVLYNCILTPKDDRTICWTGQLEAHRLFIANLMRDAYCLTERKRKLNPTDRRPTVCIFISFVEEDFVCDLVLKKSAFVTFDEAADLVNPNYSFTRYSRNDASLKTLIQYFYTLKDNSVLYLNDVHLPKMSIQDLYDYVSRSHPRPSAEQEDVNHDLQFKYQHENLFPSLRRYQADAIHWMIYKENSNTYESDPSSLHPLWETITTDGGEVLYVNPYNGNICRVKPKPVEMLPKGGILADEMGLGKTVEILGLIMNNQMKDKFQVTLAKLTDFAKNEKTTRNEGLLKGLTPSVLQGILISSPCKGDIEVCMPEQEIFISSQSNGQPAIGPRICSRKRLKGDLETDTAPKRTKINIDLWSSNCLLEENFDMFTNQEVIHLSEVDNKNVGNDRSYSEGREPMFCSEDSCNQCQIVDECVERETMHEHDDEKDDNGDSTNSESEDREICKYQRKGYPPKMKISKSTCLKYFRDDHSYCQPRDDDNLDFDCGTCCCLCGDNSRNVDDITKVRCNECTNVMHRECAGYTQMNISTYECPTCAMKQMTESHCTLIVCPDMLLTQWTDEVKKHVKEGTMKYMVYQGVKVHKFLQPKMLAEYDLILTSFSTLRLDFNYVLAADQKCRQLRRKKKYVVLPCPLLAINFWRLCIDEAQMVETDNTKLAEMALRISAVHKWCVTGTPLQKSVEDLYGLFLFLSVKPYSQKAWFKRALLDHYSSGNHKPLFNLTSRIMWRTSKKDIQEQLGLPKQTEYLTWLQFSAVERHFYQKQLVACSTKIANNLNNTYSYLEESLKLSDLEKQTLNQLLYPLLHLRQACNHPAVVRNSYISMEKKCVTMDQLLEKLIINAKLESEEAHRQLVCAMNGLAGVEVLIKNYAGAVELYIDIVKLWNTDNDLKTDSLQRLHTLHNLLEVINEYEVKCPDTLNLKEIQDQLESIQSAYLYNIHTTVKSSETTLQEAKDEVETSKKKLDARDPWWMNVIYFASIHGLSNDLLQRILDELSTYQGFSSVQLQGMFKSLSGLQLVLSQQLEKIENQRIEVFDNLKLISAYPHKATVQAAAECCLRPMPDSEAPRCDCCVVDDVINQYERVLFSQHGHNFESESSTTTGFRSETEVDRVLKVFASCAKSFGCRGSTVDQAETHMKYQAVLKKEFKGIRSAYFAYHQRVQALDELGMCTMRLRMQYEFETNVENQPHILKYCELPTTKLSLQSDKLLASNELKKRQSQLLYLKNLSKVQTEHDGYNPETCPVCVCQFGAEWAVFKCGHCFCCRCVVELQKQSYVYVAGNLSCFKCPMCRAPMKSHDISFVVTKLKKLDGFDAHVSIKGHYSSKIEAVVRRVRWIRMQDMSAKIIVFSTWTDVIYLVSSALSENDIPFQRYDGNPKHFQTGLAVFKDSTHVNVLLLPLHAGSKGLNIIEATHVILVEPALNPADEMQAVGRVHRIGQTKETFVHRFVVRGTVEERMYSLLKTKSQQDEQKSAVPSLTVGDLSCLFT